MARETDRLEIPFPDQGENPYFNTFKSMMNNIDDRVFSAVVDRNLIIKGGGDWTFDAGNDTVSWSSDITIHSHVTGYRVNITGPDSVTIEDGWFGYGEIVRTPQSNSSISMQSAAKLSQSMDKLDDLVVMFRREGSELIFRNSAVLSDIDTKTIFEGFSRPKDIRTYSGDQTLDSGDGVVLADASSSSMTITLPPALDFEGREFTIKKIDSSSNNVTLDGSGTERVEGSSTYDITGQYDSVTVISDGNEWWII